MLKMRGDGIGNYRAVREMNKRLAAVENKFKLLFDPENAEQPEMNFTEETFLETITAGIGTYWRIENDTLYPMSTKEVVENIMEDIEDNDIFYDFNRKVERL